MERKTYQTKTSLQAVGVATVMVFPHSLKPTSTASSVMRHGHISSNMCSNQCPYGEAWTLNTRRKRVKRGHFLEKELRTIRKETCHGTVLSPQHAALDPACEDFERHLRPVSCVLCWIMLKDLHYENVFDTPPTWLPSKKKQVWGSEGHRKHVENTPTWIMDSCRLIRFLLA